MNDHNSLLLKLGPLLYLSRLLLIPVIFILLITACSQTSEEASDLELVWEGWEHIKESYISLDKLDMEEFNQAIINSILDSTNKPAYPLLKDLDSVRLVPIRVPGELSDIYKLWSLIKKNNPDMDPNAVVDTALKSMLNSLDEPSAAYLTADEYMRSRETLSGNYEGIGASVGMSNGNIMILGVMNNSPAQQSGIKANDIIKRIGNTSVEGYTVDETVDLVRGPKGSKVSITLERDQGTEVITEIIRGNIDVPTIDVHLLPGAVGYIAIGAFSEHTGDEFSEALQELMSVDTLALIIDLRNNLGGSIESGLDISSQLLSKNLFIFELDRSLVRKDWIVKKDRTAPVNVPLAILVNELTSSTAEAVAASLQDHERAIIIGMPTIGQGSSNEFLELSDGSAFYVPVSNWFTPSGKSIHGIGIEPDIPVQLNQDDLLSGRDTQLIEAYQYLDKLLPAFQ